MSVLTVLRAFQSVNRSVTGIKRAPDPKQLPRALNDDDLPMAITLPTGGRYTRISDFSLHFRDVTIRVFVKPVAQGEDVSAHLELVSMLIQAMAEKYLSDITLGSKVQHIGTGARFDPPTLEDTGIMVLEYAGSAFVGFEIYTTAKEQVT